MTGFDRAQAAEDGSASGGARPGLLRAIAGATVLVLVLGGACYAVYRDRHDFLRALRHIGPGAAIASYGLGLVGVALTYLAWRAVLRGLDVRFAWKPGARVFFISQLGKYLPGSVWPIVMQMEAGRARGASRRTMLTANLMTILIGCAAGLLLAAAVLPFADTEALRRYWLLLVALPLLLGLLHPRVIPWLLDTTLRLLGREPTNQRLRPADSLRAGGASLASSVLQGAHVAVLVVAVGGGGTGLWLAVGGMALAVSGGILFIPAPAGAGVRDAILVLVLSQSVSHADALAVVIASRAILIAVDLSLAGAAALMPTTPRITRATVQ